MIWEKIRSKIGQLIMYFIAGEFVRPLMLDKKSNYLFVLKRESSNEELEELHKALGLIIDGEFLVVQGVELNIIGLADED